jgi:ubiquinone/menaquinone biosynthesis C-methylase UbiE
MTGHGSDSSQVAQSWDAYWRGAQQGPAGSAGGTSLPVVLSFWDEYFTAVRNQYGTPRIIDIASGNGAVLERAKRAFGEQQVDFTCLDISASAVAMLERRFPGIHGIVSDVRSIPLESAGYDIATSQFGIEYAGLEAIDEVARLIAPGGQLALLLHNRAGVIYRQCAASLEAIERMQRARFIPCSIAMFEEGFAACRGADRTRYDAAAKQLLPAIREMESILMQHGRHVADGTIIQLYEQVSRIQGRMQHYEPSEVLAWLASLDREMPAYAGRLASMCNVAIDARAFKQLCDRLRERGYLLKRSEALEDPVREGPLAWALVATKP